MVKTPLHAGPDGPHPEPHETGNRWLDLVLAGSAILISTVSLFVAFHHSKVEERLVEANSRPILFFASGNIGANKEPMVELTVRNDGAGAALLRYIDVAYEGRHLTGWSQLANACCGVPTVNSSAEWNRLSFTSQKLGRIIIPAGKEQVFLTMAKNPGNQEVWGQLDRARFKLKFDACYCSLLGDCWRSDLSGDEPRAVKACPTTGGYSE